MQLILAIEPDRRQAAQITAMVRGHLDAELVIAGTTSKALKALGERVPDLILTPALLPPADDAMLADRLRELGPAAAHIQAVTIPILSEAGGEGQDRGMLSALRRDRPRANEDGCEPSVFINQVATYLQRAAQERQARATQDTSMVDADHDQVDTAPAPADVVSASEAEWIDIDQVMAAITDQRGGSEKPSRGAVDDRQTVAAPVASVAPKPIIIPPAPAPAPSFEYVSAPVSLAVEDPDPDQWAFFDPAQKNFAALLT